jgi:hypothetical protein
MRLQRHRAEKRVRQAQQGLGRPIIATKLSDHRVVAVGNTVYFSPTWRAFPDFLADYLKQKIGSDWGNTEIAKPLPERHPLMQWYDAYCRYQQKIIKAPGEIHSAPATGIVACYLGLAYSLYLLDHNAELQARLIGRLKNPGNFQGAYYELIVANTLIRAGFTLTLEDETDATSKHCEFAAVSPKTGKKYWVEAKMRSVAGMLGKTSMDGGPDRDPISQLIPHLNAALRKPAEDERLIFIDLNAEPALDAKGRPDWHDRAIVRLERYEASQRSAGVTAYVFVTNISFHRQLDEEPMLAAAPFGLGMADFNRPGFFRVSEAYRRKQKHIDAYEIGDSLTKYNKFPATFDGSMPSDVFGGKPPRPTIGETYFFEVVGIVGTVTAATVNEQDKHAYIAVTDSNGNSHLLRKAMSDGQLADYREHPDAYFGVVMQAPKQIKDRYEHFEWLMQCYKDLSRAELIERLAKAPHFDALTQLGDEDLRAEYCEGMLAAFEAAGIRSEDKS